MEDNKMKELVFKFLNMMGEPELVNVSDTDYDIYNFGINTPIFGILRIDSSKMLAGTLSEYIQRFIPIEYIRLRDYTKEWIKEKYVDGNY